MRFIRIVSIFGDDDTSQSGGSGSESRHYVAESQAEKVDSYWGDETDVPDIRSDGSCTRSHTAFCALEITRQDLK